MSYLEERRALKLGTLVRPKKEPKPIAKKSAKKIAEEKEEKKVGKPVSKLELDKWFSDIAKEHVNNGGAICMECGAFIPAAFIRHATAHLLPKKLFKSIATHPLNYLILGAGCGCHTKTDRIDLFIKMKVWPEAKDRINQMLPLLPFDELKHISSQLTKALEN